MADKSKTNYSALTERLTGSEPLTASDVRTGNEAAAAGHELLLREYKSDASIAQAMRSGRPRVGSSKQGESPTVRARIDETDYLAFKELETELGKKQSELVRDAVHLLLQYHHKVAS